MKTIGYCKHCRFWSQSLLPELGRCRELCETRGEHFGCIRWQDKHRDLPNYPTTSAEERRIADLEAENQCAAEEIARLGKMICDLGFDPTKRP